MSVQKLGMQQEENKESLVKQQVKSSNVVSWQNILRPSSFFVLSLCDHFTLPGG